MAQPVSNYIFSSYHYVRTKVYCNYYDILNNERFIYDL